MQFSLKATYCKFSASSGKNCSWQSHPSTRTHAWCGGCASKNALSTTRAWKASSLLRISTNWGGSRHTHSERTGFEQRSKIAAAYHQLLALGRCHEEEFWGTHWFRCCGTGILTRNPAEPWVVMRLRLNIQDFEEELQPNALLASIQSMEKCGKIWNMCMVCQQVLTAKRLEREKNAGKRVVIQSCVCPYTFCSSWCFLDKIQSLATSRTPQTQVAKPWRNKLCLRRTLQEVNIRGKQYDSHHSYIVPDGSRLETNSCCAQYFTRAIGTLFSLKATHWWFTSHGMIHPVAFVAFGVANHPKSSGQVAEWVAGSLNRASG